MLQRKNEGTKNILIFAYLKFGALYSYFLGIVTWEKKLTTTLKLPNLVDVVSINEGPNHSEVPNQEWVKKNPILKC